MKDFLQMIGATIAAFAMAFCGVVLLALVYLLLVLVVCSPLIVLVLGVYWIGKL